MMSRSTKYCDDCIYVNTAKDKLKEKDAEISRLTQRNIDLCGELDTITEKVYKETWDKAAGELQRKDAEIAEKQVVINKLTGALADAGKRQDEQNKEIAELKHDLIQAKDRLKFTSDCKGSCEGCRYAKKDGAGSVIECLYTKETDGKGEVER